MTTDDLLPRVDTTRLHSAELKDGGLLGEPPLVADERARQSIKARLFPGSTPAASWGRRSCSE